MTLASSVEEHLASSRRLKSWDEKLKYRLWDWKLRSYGMSESGLWGRINLLFTEHWTGSTVSLQQMKRFTILLNIDLIILTEIFSKMALKPPDSWHVMATAAPGGVCVRARVRVLPSGSCCCSPSCPGVGIQYSSGLTPSPTPPPTPSIHPRIHKSGGESNASGTHQSLRRPRSLIGAYCNSSRNIFT